MATAKKAAKKAPAKKSAAKKAPAKKAPAKKAPAKKAPAKKAPAKGATAKAADKAADAAEAMKITAVEAHDPTRVLPVGTTVLLTASCSGNPQGYAWTGCSSTGATCTTSSSVAGSFAFSVPASRGATSPDTVTTNSGRARLASR